ncbi:hypothetical protein J4221_03355 [Candidatus Pacearchaeota archaeon]|nr:hypothetical protein [Candidatus Pacearchaeota archaeon]
MVNTRDYTSALIDITDDGPGKENWFQLGDYMKALKFEARDRNVPYHQVLEERASQISRNLRTVFGRWIEQHNREFEELMKMDEVDEKNLKDLFMRELNKFMEHLAFQL